MTRKEMAAYLEQTNLEVALNRKQIDYQIDMARKYKFYGLCITPGWISYAKKELEGTGIKIVTVPNWKMGGGLERCTKNDDAYVVADEVDYIWDIVHFAHVKNWKVNEHELAEIRKAVPGTLKIIVETTMMRMIAEKSGIPYEPLLKDAIDLVNQSGADFIKTDSGLAPRNLQRGINDLYEDVAIMKKYSLKPIKASAGIRHAKQAEELIKLGASRIGTSRGDDIMNEIDETIEIVSG